MNHDCPPVFITTSDDYAHLCAGFAYQWARYCDWPLAFIYANVALPPTGYHAIGVPSSPRDWAGMVRKAIEPLADDFLILGLEDMWLSGPVDMAAIARHYAYIRAHDDVQRIDLTDDRKGFPYVMRDGYYQAVVTPGAVEYLCSSQFGIWRKAFLLHSLRDGELSPQMDVEGSKRVSREVPPPVVLGTGDWPIPYHPDGVVWNRRLDNLRLDYLTPEDVAELKALGYA